MNSHGWLRQQLWKVNVALGALVFFLAGSWANKHAFAGQASSGKALLFGLVCGVLVTMPYTIWAYLDHRASVRRSREARNRPLTNADVEGMVAWSEHVQRERQMDDLARKVVDELEWRGHV